MASSSETTLICSPACAGKTRAFSPRVEPSWAHPRVCGENLFGPGIWPMPVGSSPRVRGKPHHSRHARHVQRLIPARAGKTRPLFRFLFTRTAHPRVCGENTTGVAKARRAAGSSPRVRGKPREYIAAVSGGGLIPACAGKTCPDRPQQISAWAHPRVCGENVIPVIRVD